MESNIKLSQQHKNKKRDIKIQSIYSRGLLTRNITLPITTIGKNIKETIEENIKFNYEGKCLVEGFIKQNSIKIITYSSGVIYRGNNIMFEVVFECEICFPVEGMLISCLAKNITKAGIRAESALDIPSPVVVFVAKDHHYNMSYFSEIQEGDKITVRVIGQRFELNDKYISIIAELVKPKFDKDTIINKNKEITKSKIIIEDE
jgi:DNA-directed RNA polymerase subunit E'/Rpb7